MGPGPGTGDQAQCFVSDVPPSTLHKWQEDGDFNAVTHTNIWHVLTQARARTGGTESREKATKFANLA